MNIQLNPNKNIVSEIRQKLKENNGYCPCKIIKNKNTKCMCKEFKDAVWAGYIGECHCGLYISGGIKNDR